MVDNPASDVRGKGKQGLRERKKRGPSINITGHSYNAKEGKKQEIDSVKKTAIPEVTVDKKGQKNSHVHLKNRAGG